MARLPQPGGDAGNWGAILNDYLAQSHKADGQLKDNSVTTTTLAPDSITAVNIADGSITEAHLDSTIQASLNKADEALTESVASATYAPLFRVTGSSLQAAADAAVAAGGGTLWVPEGETVTITTATEMPPLVHGLRVDGEIIIGANVSLLTRTGAGTGSSFNITAPIAAGARTVSATAAAVSVDDWVMVVSSDTLPGTTDKLGYLRRVRAVDTTTVSFDVSIPRNMPDSTRRLRKVNLASAFEIFGSGMIRYADQATCTSTMLSFRFCENIEIRGVTLRDGGSRCIQLGHVAGFYVNCVIDNFADDVDNGHVGYGVDAAGATRDGIVEGRISRCRHAFTTNVGPSDPGFNFYGEPENITVRPITFQCTDKALDTHRAGWGIRLQLNDKGSGGGVQVRADAVYVDGISDGVYVGAPLVVQADLIVPPTVGPFKVLNSAGGGIVLNGSATFTALPETYNLLSGTPITFNSGATMQSPGRKQVIRLASSMVINNTTTQAPVSALAFQAEAHGLYKVNFMLIYDASQVADMAIGWTVPSGSTMDWAPDGLSSGATSTGGSVVRQYRTAADIAAVGGVAVGTKVVAKVEGILTIGATAGTVTPTAAQLVAEATNATVQAGSTIIIERLI